MNKSQALPKLATYIGNPRRHSAVIPRLSSAKIASECVSIRRQPNSG